MAPIRLRITRSPSSYLTTSPLEYSTSEVRVTRRISAQSTPRTPPSASPEPLASKGSTGGHKTTPSGSDLLNLEISGLQNGQKKRIRSKKLQAKLNNNALCTGFEENVAACILVELSRGTIPMSPRFDKSLSRDRE